MVLDDWVGGAMSQVVLLSLNVLGHKNRLVVDFSLHVSGLKSSLGMLVRLEADESSTIVFDVDRSGVNSSEWSEKLLECVIGVVVGKVLDE